MHVVSFYHATSEGLELSGKVMYENGKFSPESDWRYLPVYENLPGTKVIEAMRDAPNKFPGSYLWAGYEETE